MINDSAIWTKIYNQKLKTRGRIDMLMRKFIYVMSGRDGHAIVSVGSLYSQKEVK